MARATRKTWLQLEQDVGETFRKWGLNIWVLRTGIDRAHAGKRYQTQAERTVAIDFWFGSRRVLLKVSRRERAVDNLALLARALEQMRLTEVRGLTEIALKLYVQMYPDQRSSPSARNIPRRPATPLRNPYATLCITGDAPLEVAEAAYRALAKQAHPDLGGTGDQMKVLNAAIEQIRLEKAR
jgi:hypothetical protein